jgi:D-glycero-alpha-D-manno-heptose-7-phosphate kinase
VLHPGSSTVNVAIDIATSVRLSPRAHGFAVVQDGRRAEAATAGDLLADPEAALAALVALHHALPPVTLELASASPRGAGLGASSSLTVALLAASEAFTTGGLVESAESRAAVARDLEARLMGLPTGLQDHLPGQLGGALAIEHRVGGQRVRHLAVDLEALGRHLLVAYTGQSHFSAGNNWSILRRRFEGDAETVARLDAIRDLAASLPEALEAADYAEAGRLVAAEWRARRGLAAEVSTPLLERLLSVAEERGAWGGKACGAGGGGSLFVLAPAERIAAIAAEWTAAGAQVLEARPTARGLEIEVRR